MQIGKCVNAHKVNEVPKREAFFNTVTTKCLIFDRFSSIFDVCSTNKIFFSDVGSLRMLTLVHSNQGSTILCYRFCNMYGMLRLWNVTCEDIIMNFIRQISQNNRS